MTVHMRRKQLQPSGFTSATRGGLASMDRLFEGRRVHRLRTGAALVVEGDERTSLYRLTDGLALRTRHLANGDRHVLGFAEPGDVIGLKQWEDRHAETVEAARDIAYQVAPLDALMAQLGADPALVAALLADAMRECRRVEDLFLLRAQQSSYRLLAGFLQKLCALVGLEVDGVLRLPLSRTEIAEHLGFSPETASRAFTRLRELGLLVPVGRRDVRIIDADGLAHLAEWRPNRLH